MRTVQVKLHGGPLDGAVCGLDLDLAEAHAHHGMYEFAVPRADVVKYLRAELPLEGPEYVYTMPIPFARDAPVMFVGPVVEPKGPKEVS